MASSSTQDVVNNSQSVSDSSPIDVHASKPTTASAGNGALSSATTTSAHDLVESQQETALPNSKSDATTAQNSATESLDLLSNSLLDDSRMPNGITPHLPNGDLEKSQESRHIDEGSQSQSIYNVVTKDDATNTDHLDHGAGSDTDLSRTDSTEQSRDNQDKLSKLNAAKKATSFKSVSVTKNFLAKTVTTPPTAKLGDKGPTVIQPQAFIAKPRLVAKSGSGLRDSPRPRPGPEGASDGATVWNKNRPAPPAPPKQFTDEELKQQYGIHLASRIQADDTGKQSKWADIDDDEDDWAPETVEWMDGTKSTIVAEPTAPEAPKMILKEEVRAPGTRQTLALKRPTAITGPPKTILRPGALIASKTDENAGKASAQSDSFKAPGTTSPAPAKSPWAPLPPVEKTAPVFAAPPPQQQQQTARFAQRDAHGFDAMPTPPPAHEIEADTFDRSWRDSDRGPRELFNSQSGTYEPAPSHRRQSMRSEHPSRQPALLQRPSQQDIGSPAEPSSAFQTRSAHTEGMPWGRRRGSSVSGTSGSAIERRQSTNISETHVIPEVRAEVRAGIVIGHDIGPQAPKAEITQAQRAQQQASERDEELARQRKIMQEKRELAIKRRKEQEEREEAEKKERIRKKLESLGAPPPDIKQPVPDSKSIVDSQPSQTAQDDVQAAQSAKVDSAVEQSDVTAPTPAQNSAAEVSNLEAQIPKTSLSPETTNGAQSQPLQNIQSDPGPQPATALQKSLSSLPPPLEQSPSSFKQPSPRGFSQSLAASHSVPHSSYSSPGEQKAQPAFKSPVLGADSFATWGHSGMTTHTSPGSNVWGPPTAGRGIGNGAFDTGYSRFAPRNQGQGIPSSPFSQQKQSRISPQVMRQQDTSPMMHQQLLSDQNLASLGLTDGLPNERLGNISSGASPVPEQSRPQKLSPIAPPPRAVPRNHQQNIPIQSGVSAWGQFAAQDPAERARAEQQAQRDIVNLAQAKNDPNPKWTTNFKQTSVTGSWQGASRVSRNDEVASQGPDWKQGQTSGPSGSAMPAPPVSQTQIVMPQQTIGQISTPAKENTVRLPSAPSSFLKGPHARTPPRTVSSGAVGPQQSRFFPSAVYGGSPPPEESDHPVFSGNAQRPRVRFPVPKPQVRLPPSSIAAQDVAEGESPVVMPQRLPSYRVGAQPLVQSSDWQARFNGLFGRIQTTTATPPSPPKTPPKMMAALPAVLVLSKDNLFDQPESGRTTVSLPQSPKPQAVMEEEVVTRPTVDDIFDGELSFGSTPKVAIPKSATYAEAYSSKRPHLLTMRPAAKFDRRVEPESKDSPTDDINYVAHGDAHITIYFPMSNAPSKDVPFRPKTKSTPRKASAKFNKASKRGNPENKTESGSGNATPQKLNSRQASFQNSNSPAVSSPGGTPDPVAQDDKGSESATASPKPKHFKKKAYKGRKPSGMVQSSA